MKNKESVIKVAILGSRGLPPRYGAFETFVDILVTNLPQESFSLAVHCESKLKKDRSKRYDGVELFYTPVLDKMRIISEPFSDLIAIIWASLKRFDIIYLFGYAASPFCIIPRLLGRKVVINVDGLEWKRRKFSAPLRFLLKVFERIAAYVASSVLCDSIGIQDYYLNKYRIKNSFFIAYPAPIIDRHEDAMQIVADMGLAWRGYYLIVARLEPENNIDLIIREFIKSNAKKLVIAGPIIPTNFVKQIMAMVDKRVEFLGAIYDRHKLESLRLGCFAYLHGHEVGGTNPSLLEALGCGSLVLALDVSFNREAARDAGRYFKKDPNDLSEKINSMDEMEKVEAENLRRRARQIVAEHYSLELIVGAYAKMFSAVHYRKKPFDKHESIEPDDVRRNSSP